MRWLQFRVVLWKNYIVRKRHWLLTILEALLPILLFLLIAYGRSKITGLNKTEHIDATFNEVRLVNYEGLNIDDTHILYTPNSVFYREIIENVKKKFGFYNNNIHEFSTEQKLLEYYATYSNRSIIAIVFKGTETNFDYTIRYHESHYSWETHRLYNDHLLFNPGSGSDYEWKGFLSLQKALDFSFIETKLGKDIENNVSILLQEFPYPPYNSDAGLSSFFADYLPVLTVFSFIFLCPAVLKRVVEEKHSGIKELMKMVGMKSWMLWLGWFIYGMVPILISIIIIVMLLKIPFFDTPYPPIEFSDGSVLFFFLVLYCAAAIVFCFFISTWFSKPTLAMITGILVWILSYFIPKYVLESYLRIPFGIKILLNLFPNMALHYGYSAVSKYEQREVGIQWNNIHLSGSGGTDDITMLYVFVMLFFDIAFYMVLTFYVDDINPGNYGISKSVFYPLIWIKREVQSLFKRSEGKVDAETVHLENVEIGRGLIKGIELIKVYKKFGQKYVVTDLSLDIYEGRITVLLGHNGAGKTTTMGMITGMISSTKGTIKFGNKDINQHSSEVRHSLGLCPQHNLLFPDFTVSEHLEFFAKLKGKTAEQAKREVGVLLNRLNLADKANSLANTLSGGMKRKLCLGMALVGGSKVLILDEPTSGMDVESRRALWDLLLSYREEKTILITTHFMEEADALGDWIAIMANGQLKCYGTSMGLKKKYHTGYHLSLIVTPPNQLKEDIENTVKKYIMCANDSQHAINQLKEGVENTIKKHIMGTEDSEHVIKQLKEDIENTIKKHIMGADDSEHATNQLKERIENIIKKHVTPRNDSEHVINQLKEDIENTIKKHIMGAECKSINGNNIVFLLPFESSPLFPNMLKSLEDKREQLRIDNISITVTTLEDVFLKTKMSIDGSNSDETDFNKCDSKDTDNLILKFEALFVKRWNFLRKKYLTYAISCSIALAFFLFSIFLSNSGGDYYSEIRPQLKLRLSMYGSTGYAYYNGSNGDPINHIKDVYKRMVQAENGEPSDVPDVSLAIIKEGIDNIAYYREHMIIGAEFKNDNGALQLVGLYNGLACHSAPISLNLITNALARTYLSDKYTISATNWPLPNINANSSPTELSEIKVGLLWLIMIPIGCLFILGSFILFPHTELSTNFTQLQFMCGVKPYFYWMVNFIADFVLYLLVVIVLVVLMFTFWKPCQGANEFGALFVILMMYGLCGIPYTYLFSRKKSASGAFAFFVILGIFVGIIMTLIVGLLFESGDEHFIRIGNMFNVVGSLLLPQYALSYTAVKFAQKAIENYNMRVMEPIKWFAICSNNRNPCCDDRNSYECAAYKSYLPNIQTNLLLMLASFILYMIVNVVLHMYLYKQATNKVSNFYYNNLKAPFNNMFSKKENDQTDLIDDVNNDDEPSTGTLRARKLRKSYSGKPVVKGIQFGVTKGECLGILGVNGAGKTTTFKMLTREEVRDGGTIFADLDDIEQDSYLSKLGYCPQEDALNFALTGRQILEVMASLRGIQDKEKRRNIVENFLDMFELREYADIPCGQYSGGNKRKLSLAVALVGFPSYVLLDEPTNGVDPSSRRKFWTLIKKAQDMQKTSFILTSHSMAECEALCNTLKIMKKGRICRDGTIAKLKKEVNGYTLKLKLNLNRDEPKGGYDEPDGPGYEALQSVKCEQPQELTSIEEVKTYLDEHYHGEVKDQHTGLLHYYIDNKENKRLSVLFKEIEELKQNFSIIEDYTLCEASLEDVFLSVAREDEAPNKRIRSATLPR